MSMHSIAKKQLMMQHNRKDNDFDSTVDDISVDLSQVGLNPGHDVMADFGGFLEKRKRDKKMERNSMMSQIDGLVNNLHSDIDKMMMSARGKKKAQKKYA